MEKNKIDINITNGRLESFSINIGEDRLPSISATIGLYTDGGKRITTYSVDTRNYYGDNQIDLPIGTIPAIQKIAEEIEIATIRKCREGQLCLSDNNEDF